MSFTDTKKMVFNPANWFELYYRLGFNWDKADRENGVPDSIEVAVPGKGSLQCPQGTLFQFEGTTLTNVLIPGQKTIVVDDTIYQTEKVKFSDLQIGDTAIFIITTDNPTQLWMGEVTTLNETVVWTDHRVYAVYNSDTKTYIKHGQYHAVNNHPVVFFTKHETTGIGKYLYRVTGINAVH